jgi:hypothetical protein
MRIVTDTTPLNYLILIGYVEVLATLYGHMIIPQAVANELRDPRTPDIVRTWKEAARRSLLDLPTAIARLLCVRPGQKEKGCGL